MQLNQHDHLLRTYLFTGISHEIMLSLRPVSNAYKAECFYFQILMNKLTSFSALEQYATPKCTVIALDVQDIVCSSPTFGYGADNAAGPIMDFIDYGEDF